MMPKYTHYTDCATYVPGFVDASVVVVVGVVVAVVVFVVVVTFSHVLCFKHKYIIFIDLHIKSMSGPCRV